MKDFEFEDGKEGIVVAKNKSIKQKPLTGISGWLAVFATWSILQAWVLSLVQLIIILGAIAHISSSIEFTATKQDVSIAIFATGFTVIFFAMIVSFFRKKRSTLRILYLLLLYSIIVALSNGWSFPTVNLAIQLGWIFYFHKSKRVQNTLIR